MKTIAIDDRNGDETTVRSVACARDGRREATRERGRTVMVRAILAGMHAWCDARAASVPGRGRRGAAPRE
ncbi:hypothetical protein [Burkholderia thailandensis]|uniref:hypothetical protein n=1 Tax=Burkholderia thailandensis TaxID=57975 RepID=UPI001184F583|nr:hypothetical protein [Burkholderia thailandensis]